MILRFGLALIFLVLFLSAKHVSAEDTPPEKAFSLPFLDWYMQIDLRDFDLKKNLLSVKSDKRFAEARGALDTNFILSVHMDRYSDSKDCKQCRIYFIHKLKPIFVPDYETLITENGDTAFWEFIVKEYEGNQVNHKNLNIVMAKDSVCINIHISKLNYTEADKAVFDRIASSLVFLPKMKKSSDEALALYETFAKTQAEPLRRELLNSNVSLLSLLAYIQSIDSIDEKFKMIDKFFEAKPQNGLEFAYLERGILFYINNEFEKAIESLSQSISLNDEIFLSFHFRGAANKALEKYGSAIADFTKSIELEPSPVHSYMGRAESFWKLRETDKALEDYSTVIKIDNKVDGAYVFRGIAYNEMKEYEKAIKDWKKAIELDKEWEKELNPMIEKAEKELKGGR